MSIRNVYQVIVDEQVVFTGSYRTAISVYNAFDVFNHHRPMACPKLDIIVAFKPNGNNYVKEELFDV